MTILEQILEVQLKANAWLGYTTLTKGQVLLCVKKWLQQGDRTTNELLKELEKKEKKTK